MLYIKFMIFKPILVVMDIKAFGAPPPGPALETERDLAAAKVRSQSAFVRATPPEASPQTEQEEIRQGIVRMADFLKKVSKKKPGKKRRRSPRSALQRALASYSKVAQSETSESAKGIQLSINI